MLPTLPPSRIYRSASGLNSSWVKLKTRMENARPLLPGLTLKDLRHTVATMLRKASMAPRAIADLHGQKTESMEIHYSRSADLTNRSRGTLAAQETENKNGQKLSNLLKKTAEL